MKIAVLFGGTSEERDVSIASAAQVIPVLRALGHEVVAVDTAVGRLSRPSERKLLESRVAPAPPSDQSIASLRSGALTNPATSIDPRSVDVVFLALHGGAGEDGRVQAMLDLAGLPTRAAITSRAPRRWTRISPSGCSVRPACRRRTG